MSSGERAPGVGTAAGTSGASPDPSPPPQGGWGELRAQLAEWRRAIDDALPPWWSRALAATAIMVGIVLPFAFSEASGFMDATIKSVALAVMALGLNIVVGFAGL